MKNESFFTLTDKTKGTPAILRGVPFAEIKDAVLGKDYDLSLVIVGNALSKKLNKIYRDKDKPTNVLSFSIEKNEGEIFINTKKAALESSQFDLKPREMVAFLFIHALLHLKGMAHGSKMESEERKFCKRFGI